MLKPRIRTVQVSGGTMRDVPLIIGSPSPAGRAEPSGIDGPAQYGTRLWDRRSRVPCDRPQFRMIKPRAGTVGIGAILHVPSTRVIPRCRGGKLWGSLLSLGPVASPTYWYRELTHV